MSNSTGSRAYVNTTLVKDIAGLAPLIASIIASILDELHLVNVDVTISEPDQSGAVTVTGSWGVVA